MDTRRVIAVVFKSEGRNIYTDSRTLIDYGFENFKNLRVIRQHEVVDNIEIERAEKNGLDLLAEKTIVKMLPTSYESMEMEHRINLIDPIELPIDEGQIMGTVQFFIGETFIAETNLVADRSISEDNVFKSISDVFTQKDRPKDMRYWFDIILKVLMAFIIWRAVVTFMKIQRRRRA